jgi:hypothetical protein
LIIVGLHLFYQQFDSTTHPYHRKECAPSLPVDPGIVAGAVFAGVLGILLAARPSPGVS